MVINPAFPLRSALVHILQKPACHRVSVDELANAADVAPHRACAFLTLVAKEGAVSFSGGYAYPTTKWGYYVEETLGVTAPKSRVKSTCLTRDQRESLKGIRDEFASGIAADCRRSRAFLGLTVPQLAKEAGVSVAAAQKVLEGLQPAPAFTLVLVTHALAVDLSEHIDNLKSRICEVLGGCVG